MTIKKVFKSTIPNSSFIFKNGKYAPFLQGAYATDIKSEISELMEEIVEIGTGNSHHPYIYVDEKLQEIDSDALSPIEVIKKNAYAQALADVKAAMAKDKISTSEQSPRISGIANSDSIGELNSGGSNSSDEAVSAASKIQAMQQRIATSK